MPCPGQFFHPVKAQKQVESLTGKKEQYLFSFPGQTQAKDFNGCLALKFNPPSPCLNGASAGQEGST
jgi:hypothetical protein